MSRITKDERWALAFYISSLVDGEPVCWIATKEYFYNYNMALSFKDQLDKVGFEIDLQVS